MKLLNFLLMFGVLVALSACSASSHVVTGEVREPVSSEQVEIYRQPPTSYKEIAILTGTSENSLAGSEQGKMDVVIAALKEEAAGLGANGVLIIDFGTSTTNFGGTDYSGSQTNLTAEALAIHVEED